MCHIKADFQILILLLVIQNSFSKLVSQKVIVVADPKYVDFNVTVDNVKGGLLINVYDNSKFVIVELMVSFVEQS